MDAGELHVRAIGERGVALDQRAEAPDLRLVQAGDEDDAVGVADRHGGDSQDRASHLERDADDLPVGTIHGDLGCAKRCASHLDRHGSDASARGVADALHDAALGLHGERRRLRVAVLGEVFGEDP